ncbi:aminoglycoside 3'-phosphotransferase [Nonomuraea lactucae]|uniref:aminoglycoside 3'-phosphotransferase n=1 Tax=Nonomuraea lactucae TaxID=2249762 RepID=UPI000DE4C014|nr:aminoglycoside 3'-phosphotransferase [Nonomuraea lactucae]
MRLPGRIFDLFGDDAVWSDDHEGVSGETLRVTSPAGVHYVKQGPTARREHERLLWLKRWLSVPDVVAFDDDALVLADAGWRSLEHRPPPHAGATMGRVLRALHDIPVRECPFDERLDVRLARARERVDAGLVDPADFDDDHAGLSPEQVYERLVAERPASEDLVVTHGDFTPSNVLSPPLPAPARSGPPAGEPSLDASSPGPHAAPPPGPGSRVCEPVLVDVGALGVADRYVDLAIALRDLEGPAAEDFLAAYGLPEPDPRRLDYYRLMDELF